MSKKTQPRGINSLNNLHWDQVLRCPSRSPWALNGRGNTTARSFLADIARFMKACVKLMNLANFVLGKSVDNGLLLETWESVSKECNLPLWRIKQCFEFAHKRGWMTSVQSYEKDADGNYKYNASIKRITAQYFHDLGLTNALNDAHNASIRKLVERVEVHNKPLPFYLTPITLLQKIASKAGQLVSTFDWHTHFKQARNYASI